MESFDLKGVNFCKLCVFFAYLGVVSFRGCVGLNFSRITKSFIVIFRRGFKIVGKGCPRIPRKLGHHEFYWFRGGFCLALPFSDWSVKPNLYMSIFIVWQIFIQCVYISVLITCLENSFLFLIYLFDFTKHP